MKRRASGKKSVKTGQRSSSGRNLQPSSQRHPAAARAKTKKTKKPSGSPQAQGDTNSVSSDRAFSWYPGHMVKAKRELEANLKLADAVLLMLDARAPNSTRHPELEEILSTRTTPFLLVLNKADLAQAEETERWRAHLKSQGYKVVEMSALKGQGTGPLTPMLDKLEVEINEKRARKGLLPREPRLMVAGLPNSGKSTLLNRLVGQTRFKAGKKPGLTRGAQWVSVAGRYQLLDTPGILYPRIEGERTLAVLSAIGSVKRDVLPMAQVVRRLFQELDSRGRLTEVLPGLEDVPEELWSEQPLECLARALKFPEGDEQERRSFERFLNLFAEKPIRITWQTVAISDA